MSEQKALSKEQLAELRKNVDQSLIELEATLKKLLSSLDKVKTDSTGRSQKKKNLA